MFLHKTAFIILFYFICLFAQGHYSSMKISEPGWQKSPRPYEVAALCWTEKLHLAIFLPNPFVLPHQYNLKSWGQSKALSSPPSCGRLGEQNPLQGLRCHINSTLWPPYRPDSCHLHPGNHHSLVAGIIFVVVCDAWKELSRIHWPCFFRNIRFSLLISAYMSLFGFAVWPEKQNRSMRHLLVTFVTTTCKVSSICCYSITYNLHIRTEMRTHHS